MDEINNERPIGVFDSGLGGLTVVRELLRALPGEDIVYFGDTGRVPYGMRGAKTIERYARQDERFLLLKGVKIIIAACGTVSSVAPRTGEELPVKFIEVVGPAARQAARVTQTGRIGVIGTRATISSGAYLRRLKAIDSGLEVFEQACPLFVPLVEAGWTAPEDPVTRPAAERYLEPLKEKRVDTLILGCTHYPILQEMIGSVMGPDCRLVNVGHAAATAAVEYLCENNLLNPRRTGGKCSFYESDRTDDFRTLASTFLGRDVRADVEYVEIDAL